MVPNRGSATTLFGFSGAPEGLASEGSEPVLPVFDVEPPHLQTGALVRVLRGKQ